MANHTFSLSLLRWRVFAAITSRCHGQGRSGYRRSRHHFADGRPHHARVLPRGRFGSGHAAACPYHLPMSLREESVFHLCPSVAKTQPHYRPSQARPGEKINFFLRPAQNPQTFPKLSKPFQTFPRPPRGGRVCQAMPAYASHPSPHPLEPAVRASSRRLLQIFARCLFFIKMGRSANFRCARSEELRGACGIEAAGCSRHLPGVVASVFAKATTDRALQPRANIQNPDGVLIFRLRRRFKD